MAGRRATLAILVMLTLLLPLSSSSISLDESSRGGFDADGDWILSVESETSLELVVRMEQGQGFELY